MASLAVRYIVQDVAAEGGDTRVVLRPAVTADSPNGTENASVWQSFPSFGDNRVQLKFKTGTGNPFTKLSQVVATFAAG